MTIDKEYVRKYIKLSLKTGNPTLKNHYLYRAGTQMEVIPCDGSTNLTSAQQEAVYNAAEKLFQTVNGQ